jgi:hypothetical protein
MPRAAVVGQRRVGEGVRVAAHRHDLLRLAMALA